MLFTTAIAVVVLARLSAGGARNAVEEALAQHLAAQAGLADRALAALPIEVLSAMVGASPLEVAQEVDGLARAANLRGLALLGPHGQIVGHGGRWLPAAAERDLIARAARGESVTGPLYADERGDLYETAYRPLHGHAGWVVAVEGSAATLGAVDALARTEARGGVAVVALAAVVGALLASLLSRPLRRLGREIAAAAPGTSPAQIGDYGFSELRQVSRAARELLAAILTRDDELHAAHRREVEQLTRMAAEIAHEVGNPLNALTLTIETLAHLDDPAERRTVLARIRQQLAALERIVERLRNLTGPLRPEWAATSVDEILDGLEMAGLGIARRGTAGVALTTDRVMVAEVLRNLLQNAIQAGATHAMVEATANDEYLDLVVVDDGPGIPEREVADVFTWFHTTRAGGTGLGLPLSRRLAETLGGRLSLDSPRPATFRLRLPRTPRAVQASA
jgi:signal transduction histidine kinase